MVRGANSEGMSWTHHRSDNSYTVTVGKARCRVWQTTTGHWGTIVRQAGRAKGSYTFATREDAQDWVVARLAEIDTRAPMRQSDKQP